MDFNPKYNMTQEQNIFVARRNIVDYIWKSANLEGIQVTYPATQTICDGMSAKNIKVNDLIAINNLKLSWEFILEEVNCETDLKLICDINRKVGGDSLMPNAGYIRNVPIRMDGTKWTPDIPIESIIEEDLEDIFVMPYDINKGLSIMLYVMRKQMFTDGNKRTAMLSANHYMISHGYGVISVSQELSKEFYELLIDFYETNDSTKIKQFLYDNCIDGINFP